MKKRLDSIQVRPEHERRKAMDDYAELQIFKLEVIAVLGLILALRYWFG